MLKRLAEWWRNRKNDGDDMKLSAPPEDEDEYCADEDPLLEAVALRAWHQGSGCVVGERHDDGSVTIRSYPDDGPDEEED